MAAPGSQKGDHPDLLTAGLFIGIGLLGLVMSRHLDFGSLARMGPGFMPRIVCLLLVAAQMGLLPPHVTLRSDLPTGWGRGPWA